LSTDYFSSIFFQDKNPENVHRGAHENADAIDENLEKIHSIHAVNVNDANATLAINLKNRNLVRKRLYDLFM
jgi:hypothetical protein